MTPEELRMEARELDLLAFARNDGYLTRAAELLELAADALEEALRDTRTANPQ